MKEHRAGGNVQVKKKKPGPKKMITDPKLPQELKRVFRSATPLMEFLCHAVDVPF